jgi:hypothetical protein
MLAGPSMASVLLTGLIDGKAGLREVLIFIFTPLATGISFLTYVWVLAAALWVVVAAVAVVYGRQLSRQPLRMTLA